MTTNRLLPLYTASTVETPLDLTVRRSDMDPCDEHVYDDSPYEMPSVSVTPPTPDYSAYQPYHHNTYYPTPDQYTPNMYVTPNHQHYNPEMCNPHVPAGYTLGHTPAPQAISGPPSPDYDTSQSPTEMTGYSSSILPKKRKNLWRPYDSKGNRTLPLDHDVDSGSDSGSNSSDQELKIQENLEDPVKRRKRNMLRYAEEHNMDKTETFSKPKPQPESSHVSPTLPMTSEMDKDVNKINDTMTSYMASSGKGGYREDSREKMISDIKKRDVFGWSLKLSKPLEGVETSEGSQTVCQDGEKTYTELQTVRTTNSPGKPSHTQGHDTNGNKEQSPQKFINAINSQGKRSPGSKGKKKNSEKEKSENFVGKTVYIQRRDNVIESYDETKDKKVKGMETTKKGLSLIDLIEEIEADALKKDQEEIEKTKQRNANIVKLLEQCNHVKLQALDYLMSNVLIQDKGPSFKNRNEKVQKMIKGDKISSFNMLDVVELQVEMGLN